MISITNSEMQENKTAWVKHSVARKDESSSEQGGK